MKKIIIAIIIFISGSLFITSGFLLFKDKDTSIPDKIEVSYPYVGTYKNGYIVASDGKKIYYLDKNNNKILEYKKDIPAVQALNKYYFKDGYAIFPKEDKLGVVDATGKEVIKPIYTKIEIIDKNTFLVTSEDGSSYFINSKEKRISKGNYYGIYQLTDTMYLASKNGTTGVINKNGDEIIPIEYSLIEAINDDKIFIATKSTGIENGNIFEFKNNQMQPLQIPEFTSYIYDDTYLYLKSLQKTNYIYNYKTKELITLKYPYEILGRFSQGLAYAGGDDRHVGFINMKEEIVIPVIYIPYTTTAFNEYGYAVAAKEVEGNISCGMIDTKNNEILPFLYDDILVLSKDLVAVAKNSFYEIKSLSNKNVSKEKYTTIEATIRKNLYIVSTGDINHLTYGLIDDQANVIYEPVYQSITVYEDQIILHDSKKYIIDLKN